jgi:hypothetical protein
VIAEYTNCLNAHILGHYRPTRHDIAKRNLFQLIAAAPGKGGEYGQRC